MHLRVAFESEHSKAAALEGALAEAQLVGEKRLLSAQQVSRACSSSVALQHIHM